MSQRGDKDSAGFGGDHLIREAMPWDEAEWDLELLTFFQDLIAIRKQLSALRSGQWQLLHLDTAQGAFSYQLCDNKSHVQITFNLGDSAIRVDELGLDSQHILLATASLDNGLMPLQGTISVKGNSFEP